MSALAVPALAQSPNTAALVVVVVDQTGARRQRRQGDASSTARPARRATSCPAATAPRRIARAAADRHLHGQRREGRASPPRTSPDLTLRARRDGDGEGEAGRERRQDRGRRSTARRRACAPTRRSAAGSTARPIDETPILGRKVTTLPLLQLRVPAGQGHRRPVRQRDLLHHRRRQPAHRRRSCSTAPTTTRAGAARRCSRPCRSARSRKCRCSRTRSRPSSAGPPGPALNIVTKSGTNALHGEGLYLGAARRLAGEDVLDRRASARRRSRRCVTPATLARDQPGRRARRAEPGLRLGRRRRSSRTRRSSSRPPTTRGRIGRRSCRPTLPAFVLPADGNLDYDGQLPPGRCSTAALDHKLTPSADADGARQLRPLLRHQSATTRSAARARRAWRARYSRRSWTAQVNHTAGAQPEPAQRGALRVSQRRSGHALGGAGALDRPTRAPARCRSRSASRASSDLFGRQVQFSDTLSWSRGRHTPALRRQRRPPHLRRHRQRAGHGDARHLHVPEHDDGAVRSADAGATCSSTRSRSATASPATS